MILVAALIGAFGLTPFVLGFWATLVRRYSKALSFVPLVLTVMFVVWMARVRSDGLSFDVIKIIAALAIAVVFLSIGRLMGWKVKRARRESEQSRAIGTFD